MRFAISTDDPQDPLAGSPANAGMHGQVGAGVGLPAFFQQSVDSAPMSNLGDILPPIIGGNSSQGEVEGRPQSSIIRSFDRIPITSVDVPLAGLSGQLGTECVCIANNQV